MFQALDSGPWLALMERHRPPGQQSTKYAVNSVARTMLEEKYLEFGSGIHVSISLIEPVLFLPGFEQRHTSERSTVVLRGSLHLRVTRPAKIKAVTLKFDGKAVTKWPQGIPPNKIKFEETNIIMKKTWPLFNAQLLTAAAGVGADQVELIKSFPGSVATQRGLLGSSSNSSSKNLGCKKAIRLSLQADSLWNFIKGNSSTNGPSVARKGYRTFPPGDYMYNFELPVDSNLPETIDLKLGSVKYKLEAIVERAGVFCAKLVGSKAVTLVRTPAEGALEQVEPIVVSRNFKDRLNLNVTISGKSFPLGAQVPISIRLTPLAKVQLHWIKVLATEHIEYCCLNKRFHRIEPVREIQLFEKRADVPPTSAISGDLMGTVYGRGTTFDQNVAVSGAQLQGLSDIPDSLSGDFIIGSKEMEFLVPLPSCFNMNRDGKASRLHSDTTYRNILVHHWIKIVMRLSMPDGTDPNKRRQFELSINSPFRILSHHVTEAITTLPAYSAPRPICDTWMHEYDYHKALEVCCASRFHFVPSSGMQAMFQENSTATLLSSGLASPQEAHIDRSVDSNRPRPTHVFRALSFDPPAFEDEGPPLSLEAPPPLYKRLPQ